MNQDELSGKAEALKGKVKQAAGDLADDPELHEEGVEDEVEGDLREAVGHAKRTVGEAVEHAGKTLKN